MPTLTVEKGQNLLDACIQAYGALDKLFDFIEENGLEGVDAELQPGQVLVFQTEPDNPVQRFYLDNRLVVNTGDSPQDEACPDSYTDPDYTDCDFTD